LSQIYVVRQDRDSFSSASGLGFQSLRVARVGRDIVTADATDTFPVAAPLVDSRYDVFQQILGGRLRIGADAVVLNRHGRVASSLLPALPALIGPVSEPPGTIYLQFSDSRRLSFNFDWRAAFTTSVGLQIAPFALGRTDAYSITDPSIVTVSSTGAKTTT